MKKRVAHRSAATFTVMICLFTWLMMSECMVNAGEITTINDDATRSDDLTYISGADSSTEDITEVLYNGSVPEEADDISGSSGEHYLAFASDRHNDTEALKSAMGGMPSRVGYVGVLGDMVGSEPPTFNSSTVLDEINEIGFKKKFSKKNAVILCGNHDNGMNDDAHIGFGMRGKGSGLMYTCKESSGNIAYYVYGIAYKDMKSAQKAKIAAKAFEQWVDTVTDRSIPIIVCCHYAMHYARKDSKGAPVWNLALNYAATGYETTEASAVVSRNVIFLYGHNHTDEGMADKYSGEFYIPCESEMEIGPVKNIWSRIFYTYTTPGYLINNRTATLITIGPQKITLTKYQDSSVTDDFYDTKSMCSGIFSNRFETAGNNSIKRVPPDAKVEKASVKADNPFLVAKKNITVKYSALKKKSRSIAASKVVTIRNNKGKLTYSKVSGNKKITVNTKTGKIKLKKGLKKGTYKIKYKITASGNEYYKKRSKTVNIEIKVK